VPNGVLNQLRRDGLASLEEEMLSQFRREEEDVSELSVSNVKSVDLAEKNGTKTICSCETKEQLDVILKHQCVSTIYLDVQMYHRNTFVENLKQDITRIHSSEKKVFLRLPVIFRAKTSEFYQSIVSELKNANLDGFVVRNYEEMQFVKEHFADADIVVDHNLYTYNDYAKDAFQTYDIIRDTVPLELNQKEIRKRNNTNSEMVVYGHYPLMTSAGCVHKNTLNCDKQSQITYLKDRYNVLFPVKNYCNDCYNVIYNSVPVLLFDEIHRLKQNGILHYRLDFSIENAKEVENVFCLYETGKGQAFDYTNGHYKRGVE